MITAFQEKYGVEVLHAWGMTEMSPLGTLCTLKNKHLSLPPDAQLKIRMKQGRAIFGVDMKIVDDDGNELPWDGKAFGDLLVKGPWIVKRLLQGRGRRPAGARRAEPRLVSHRRRRHHRRRRLHADHRPQQGRDQVGRRVDQLDRHREHRRRASGRGRWPRASACTHPKWDERPIVAVVKKPGAEVTREELLTFYEGKIAKWQIPDDVVFVEAIPIGATGKILKTKLRELLKDYKLPTL